MEELNTGLVISKHDLSTVDENPTDLPTLLNPRETLLGDLFSQPRVDVRVKLKSRMFGCVTVCFFGCRRGFCGATLFFVCARFIPLWSFFNIVIIVIHLMIYFLIFYYFCYYLCESFSFFVFQNFIALESTDKNDEIQFPYSFILTFSLFHKPEPFKTQGQLA